MVKTRRFRGGTRMRKMKSMRGGGGYNIYLEDGTPYLHFRTSNFFGSSDDMSEEKLLAKLHLGQGERADDRTNENITGLDEVQKIREDQSAAEQGKNAANYYKASMIVRPDPRSRDSNRADVIIVRHKDRNEAKRIFNEQYGIAQRAATSMNTGLALADRDRSSGTTQGYMHVGESGKIRDDLVISPRISTAIPTMPVGVDVSPIAASPAGSSSTDADWDSGTDSLGEGRKRKKKGKSRKKKKKKHHKKKSKGGSLTRRRR